MNSDNWSPEGSEQPNFKKRRNNVNFSWHRQYPKLIPSSVIPYFRKIPIKLKNLWAAHREQDIPLVFHRKASLSCCHWASILPLWEIPTNPKKTTPAWLQLFLESISLNLNWFRRPWSLYLTHLSLLSWETRGSFQQAFSQMRKKIEGRLSHKKQFLR